MQLTDLQPQWIKRIDDLRRQYVDSIGQADGVMFLCPLCFRNNGNSSIGTHRVICWSPTVPQTTQPIPGRWELRGTSFDDLSLVAGSSSVWIRGDPEKAYTELKGACGAHFFIRNGQIDFA